MHMCVCAFLYGVRHRIKNTYNWTYSSAQTNMLRWVYAKRRLAKKNCSAAQMYVHILKISTFFCFIRMPRETNIPVKTSRCTINRTFSFGHPPLLCRFSLCLFIWRWITITIRVWHLSVHEVADVQETAVTKPSILITVGRRKTNASMNRRYIFS